MVSQKQIFTFKKNLKAMHLSASDITLRSEDFYKKNDIELKLGKEVSQFL